MSSTHRRKASRPATRIPSRTDSEAASLEGKKTWLAGSGPVLVGLCALVLGVFAWCARSGMLEARASGASETYYNLLVQGFRSGQLNLKTEVPPGLARLADPYAPDANRDYRLQAGRPLHDVSFYQGKLYLYFGITPALVLFWPYLALTGHYLLHQHAVVLFEGVGFIAAAGLLCALRRRYFAEVGLGPLLAGILALGLGALTTLILPRCDVYEVAISCGSAFAMLALVATWKALHASPGPATRWLALASLAYGLAVGARPSLLLGAAFLLVPVVLQPHRLWPVLLAATGPLLLIGLALMLYNQMRFGQPFEFGQRYMMAGTREDTVQHFGLGYLWFNFRVYFLQPAHWGSAFPYVQDASIPTRPAGYGWVEHPFGVLTNVPIVWLALAAPLAWHNRSPETRCTLRGFVTGVALLFGLCLLPLVLYYSACLRYQADFVPALMVLAVIGIFGLERALACKPGWRRAARCAWGVLLAVSLAFNVLAGLDRLADSESVLGNFLLESARPDEAIGHLRQALALRDSDAAAHRDLAIALFQKGQAEEAIAHFEAVAELEPDSAEAQMNLGNALHLLPARLDEARVHFEKAAQLQPENAQAHNNLADVLAEQGKPNEAIPHYEKTVTLNTNNPQAHFNLALSLLRLNKPQEATIHLTEALRLKPDYTAARQELDALAPRQ